MEQKQIYFIPDSHLAHFVAKQVPEKELSLAPKEKVLLIENANYSDVANGNYDTQYNKKSFLASLHSFWFKYNIPVFFMPDNKYSALFIKKYFEYYLKNYLR